MARRHGCVAGGAAALLWSWDASARSLRLAMAISLMRGVVLSCSSSSSFRSAGLMGLKLWAFLGQARDSHSPEAPPAQRVSSFVYGG